MIDIEDYFEKGYVVTELPKEFVTRLWQFIYTTNWIDHNGEYKQVPDWSPEEVTESTHDHDNTQAEVERYYGRQLATLAPKEITDIGTDLIKLSMFDTLRYFKPHATLKHLQVWNGAEGIPYHYDTIDATDTLVFVYLTEETGWQEEWGGDITFRKELKSGNYYEHTVLPKCGTMVVVNNSNPLFKHRVTELKNKSVNRYTFSFCFVWQ